MNSSLFPHLPALVTEVKKPELKDSYSSGAKEGTLELKSPASLNPFLPPGHVPPINENLLGQTTDWAPSSFVSKCNGKN